MASLSSNAGIRSFPNKAARYNPGARAFHWLIALMIAGMYLSDQARDFYERGAPQRDWWLAVHASLGISILAVTVLRLIWRAMSQAPAPVPGSALMHLGAKLGHVALYGFTLGLPISGFLRHASTGRDITLFDITMSSPLGQNDTLHNLGLWLHNGAWTNLLLALIGLHVLAALVHHFVLNDGTLRRMV